MLTAIHGTLARPGRLRAAGRPHSLAAPTLFRGHGRPGGAPARHRTHRHGVRHPLTSTRTCDDCLD
eukprot:5558561-Prymnesium_polylepis.1